ncbi:hypothetical protein B9Z55_007218 [Caenorhabditis nigoni]|uniref:Peptidase M13 C-terminal domain-containing protein n=1 Tax=Caenorhabditis nigoni TaxID=1611254 RepID=A0A2G5V8S9_9PELO|nr:hypothetical protein B9Z55_007218 [Caenorhabditis nigoni]
MSLKEKCSNPLMSLVIILVLMVVALITAVIVLRLDKNPLISGPPEALKNVTDSPESDNPQKYKFSTLNKFSTNQPTIQLNSGPNIPNFKPRNVCESPECITLAQQLHNWQDPKIDPCVDFYKHSCGKYIEHTVVRGNSRSKKSKIIKGLIEEHLIKNEPTNSIAENALKVYYQKCETIKVSEDDFEENMEQSFKDILEDIKSIGPWPISDPKWNESKFDLNEVLINLAKLGKYDNGLFTFLPQSAPRILIVPVIERHEPGEFLRNNGIEKILEANGVQFDQQTLDDDFDEFLVFYEEIRRIPVDTQNMNTTHITEQIVKDRIPSINFEKILEALMDPQKKNSIEMLKNRTLIHKIDYFFGKNDNLEKLIQRTPKRVLANFFIFNYIDLFSKSLLIDQDDVGKCDEMATDNLPEAGLSVIVRNHFDRENIQIVLDLVEEIKDSFEEMIQESTWLHESTKKAGILKLRKMKKTIGYPEEFKDLDEIYKNLNLLPTDSFYTMQKKIDRLRGEMLMNYVGMESLLNPSNSLLDTNARYTPLDNHLAILVPFMDDPLFDSTFPKYAIMAGVGSVLGHEIGHGFDETGRFFDENGQNDDWWEKDDHVEYEKRMDCLVDQYNNYDDPDFGKGHFDGVKTLGEMLADGFGMDTAWRVVRKLDMEKEPKIIGFDNDNTRKIFFRVAALSFCAARNTKDIDDILDKVHPTDSFRVNGVFSNMKAFAETFNCPVGSPMNPKKKCELF